MGQNNSFFFVNGDRELILGSNDPGSKEQWRLGADDNGNLTLTDCETGEQKPVGTGGGGTGGGDSSIVVVSLDMETMKLSKTAAECFELTQAGKLVMCSATGSPIIADVGEADGEFVATTTAIFPTGEGDFLIRTFIFGTYGNYVDEISGFFQVTPAE